jgi:hypothetical protein
MDFNDTQRMKTLASSAAGDRAWLIDMDWSGDLNNQSINIVDKNGQRLFTMVDSSLEQAAYVCALNNLFVKEMKNVSVD